MIRSVCFLMMMVLGTGLMAQKGGMNNKTMEKIIRQKATDIEGETGAWQMIYRERLLLILTDEPNNRMRVFTPVAEESDISAKEMRKMLNANFQSALDAKYSLYNGFVISCFTHPLKELTKDQFIDAMKQVVNLADTFRTTYSSTGLLFGGQEEEEEEEPAREKKS